MDDKENIYDIKWENCPEHARPALRRYVEGRLRPGSFLYAVLSNNLIQAIETADDENKRDLNALVKFMYTEIPAACWGSVNKVEKWIKGGQS